MIDEEFLEGINITYKDTVQTEAYAADIKAEQKTLPPPYRRSRTKPARPPALTAPRRA